MIGIVFAGQSITGMCAKNPPDREEYVISVVSADGENVVLRDETGLEISLHRSLIDDNGITIEQGTLRLDRSLYGHWFGKAHWREAEKRFDELRRIYHDNVPLFYRNRGRIMADERLAYTPVPFSVWNIRAPILLGAMAKAWDSHPEVYCYECPKCKGTAVIFSFAGSPLSGMSSSSAICMECGTLDHSESGQFWGMHRPVKGAMEHYPHQPDVEPYGDIEEVVTLLSEPAAE